MLINCCNKNKNKCSETHLITMFENCFVQLFESFWFFFPTSLWGSCFLRLHPVVRVVRLRASRSSHLTPTHLTPLISHITSHTQLISHNSHLTQLTSHKTHPQLISHTTHLTQLISHNSSHTTHLIHNSSPSSHTQLISHNSSHKTHLTHLISQTCCLAGAVHRASWRSCGVLFAWQVQYTEPLEGVVARQVKPFISYHSSHTIQHTALITPPLIPHRSSHTTHLTPLISQHSSHSTLHTSLISRHSSHTTHHTPLITHHSSHAGHLTQLISHQSCHSIYLTPLASNHSSHTTHLTPLTSNHSSQIHLTPFLSQHSSHNHSSYTSHLTALKHTLLILHLSSHTNRIFRWKTRNFTCGVIRSFYWCQDSVLSWMPCMATKPEANSHELRLANWIPTCQRNSRLDACALCFQQVPLKGWQWRL